MKPSHSTVSQDADIRYYLSVLPDLSKNYKGVNPFWQEILEEFKLSVKAQKGAALAHNNIDALIRKLNSAPKTNYLLDLLEDKTEASKENDYRRANKLRKRLSRFPWNLTYKLGLQDRFFRKRNYEHAIGLGYLKSRSMLKPYLDFLNSLEVKSNYNTTRYYTYVCIIEKLLECQVRNSNFNVLEIGSGSANLSLFLMNKIKVHQYFFVDLPEMLLLAIYTMKRHFPQKKVCILDSPTKVGALTDADLVFIPAQFIELVPDSSAHLALNTHSFQEMDNRIRDNYFHEIYRILANDALFFNVNWFQENMTNLDGEAYDNNPLQYPYRKNSRVIMWAEDPFQSYLRRKFYYKNTKSLSTLYAGIVE